MSSKGTITPTPPENPLCQIAERVFLSAEQHTGAGLERLISQAIRQIDLTAGEKSFQLHQMPSGFQSGDLDVLPDIHSFLDDAGLDPIERIALVKSLFGTGARMLRLQADPVLIALARSLADSPGLPKATVWFDLISGYDTAIATIPMRAGFKAEDVLISLSGDALALGDIETVDDFLAWENTRQRLAAVSFSGEPVAGRYLLAGAAGFVLVDAQIRLHVNADAFYAEHVRANPDFIALFAQTDDEAAIVFNRLLRQASPANVLDEPLLGLHFVLDEAISLKNGLFVSGWFHDADSRIASVLAVDHSLSDVSISDVWKVSDGRADIAGKIVPVKRFAAFLPRKNTKPLLTSIPVRIVLDNDENHLLGAAPVLDLLGQRDRILGCIAPDAFTVDMLADVFAPAVAPVQDELNDRQSVRDVKTFGRQSTRSVSLVIPLYKETGFMRSQLMAFAIDPFVRQHCEIVYVLDDPVMALDVGSRVEGFAFAFPLDLKVVVLDRNGGYALANTMGVGEARGETLILMNSDVIPDRSGWIEPALAKLSLLPPFSVIGPKLLYADNSLQHAGLYFHQLSNGYWQNFHYWKGYGRHFTPGNVERVVPAVTGACMILRKADYEAAGGFSTDYIVGDYEDSDLCLRLREREGVPLYMPSIELYHFERQSMPPETDGQEHGSSVYNNALHTVRWSDAIADLMRATTETVDAL